MIRRAFENPADGAKVLRQPTPVPNEQLDVIAGLARDGQKANDRRRPFHRRSPHACSGDSRFYAAEA